MYQQTEKAWNKQDLMEMAKWHGYILWMLLLGGIALFIPYGPIIAGLISVYFTYKLAVAIRSSVPWLYAIFIVLPWTSFITLIVIHIMTMKIYKANGIQVGFMGAKQTEIDKKFIAE